MIPAAGEGTRLGAASEGRPKALVELGGTTLIQRLLGQLGPHVDHACIVVPPNDDRIPASVGEAIGRLRVSYVLQVRRQGVGDAVLQARSQVEGAFLVVMGDAFFSDPLGPFVESWLRSGADGAVLVEPMGEPDQPMGRVRIEGDRAVALEKTTSTEGFTDTLAGSLILPERAFAALADAEPAASGEVELETAVTQLLTDGCEFLAVPYRGWRTNVNRPGDIRLVQAALDVDGAPTGRTTDLDRSGFEESMETE